MKAGRGQTSCPALHIEPCFPPRPPQVRVEFEGDEAYWSLQDNYNFEALLQDAARYWDISPQDAVLQDERGAIWPNDAYVGLELQRHTTARISLKLKPVASHVEEDIEYYGKEGDDDDDESDDDDQAGGLPAPMILPALTLPLSCLLSTISP